MAEYTWKQWEQTQDNDNLINNAACLRWQAGIELAGGSWSGSFEDGKDSITIDEFNALEQQIQSKVSSYTPKNYDPSSTVQIVPGVDGWNKVEDGILQSICTPTGVNRNWLQNTKSLGLATGKISTGGAWSNNQETDENGFGVRFSSVSTSGSLIFYTTKLATGNPMQGQPVSFSCDMKSDQFSSFTGNWQVMLTVYGTNNFTSFSRKYYIANTLRGTASSGFWSFNRDDYVDGEWFMLKATDVMPSFDNMSIDNEGDFDYYVYSIQLYTSSTPTASWYIRKPKLEFASEPTDWVPAMEDYGYPSDTTALSANISPQSMEDGDDDIVAAPEAEEIE